MKIRSAMPIDLFGWQPRVYLDLPAFPSPDLPRLTQAAPGGTVYVEENEAGYWPVEPRTTMELMWDGRDPEYVVSSARNRLYL